MQDIEPGTHMCLIYSDRTSAIRDVERFIKQAVEDKGCAHYFATRMELESLTHGLEGLGCTAEQCKERVKLSYATDVYYPEGKFEKDEMLQTLANTFTSDKSWCSGKVHYTGEMDWANDVNLTSVEDILAYELQVNTVCKEHPFSAICQYDATMFEPDMLVEIMRAHPYVLIDGMVIPSPDYVGP